MRSVVEKIDTNDPEFGGYLCHRGTGDRFSGKLNTTSSLFRKDFQGFQYGGAIRLQDRSLLEEDRLMGELLPHRLIELDRFLSGFGRQSDFRRMIKLFFHRKTHLSGFYAHFRRTVETWTSNAPQRAEKNFAEKTQSKRERKTLPDGLERTFYRNVTIFLQARYKV